MGVDDPAKTPLGAAGLDALVTVKPAGVLVKVQMTLAPDVLPDSGKASEKLVPEPAAGVVVTGVEPLRQA